MRSRIVSIAANTALVLVSLLVGLGLLEAAFRIYPEAFPENVRALIETDDASRLARKAIVQRLPHSPFAKPYPNVDVFIPGYYGPKDNFVYEWRSDRRGFKNLAEIAARDQVDVVAVGDSFTEGMGVATEDTWVARLTRKGFPAYNLGIQGYAPTQFLGAYEHYGRPLRPKWVIIGLLGNVYKRERQFIGGAADANNWSNRKAPEAIGRLIEQDERNAQRPLYLETKEGYRVPIMVRERYRFLTTAIIALASQQINFALTFNIRAGVRDPDKDIRFAPDSGALLSLYKTEIAPTPETDPNALAQSAEWTSTLRTIERIAELARTDGARVLLVFFPNRGPAYYKRVTGRDLPSNSADLVQASAARAFAKRARLDFLDLMPAFQQAAGELTESSLVSAYPYLKIDGHPSPRGHEIIATEIERVLRQHQ